MEIHRETIIKQSDKDIFETVSTRIAGDCIDIELMCTALQKMGNDGWMVARLHAVPIEVVGHLSNETMERRQVSLTLIGIRIQWL